MTTLSSIIGTPELIMLIIFIAMIVSIVHALNDINKTEFRYRYCKLLFILLVIVVPVGGGFIYFVIKPSFEVANNTKGKEVSGY